MTKKKSTELTDVRANGVTILKPVTTAKGGRPRLVLTEDGAHMVEAMASYGCTVSEIAVAMGVAESTLRAQHNRAVFEEALIKGGESLKTRVRRAQISILENGSTAMAIFLGKNVLGQSDRAEIQVTERPPEDADIDELYVRMKKRRM